MPEGPGVSTFVICDEAKLIENKNERKIVIRFMIIIRSVLKPFEQSGSFKDSSKPVRGNKIIG